jgi:hypothetical protein
LMARRWPTRSPQRSAVISSCHNALIKPSRCGSSTHALDAAGISPRLIFRVSSRALARAAGASRHSRDQAAVFRQYDDSLAFRAMKIGTPP